MAPARKSSVPPPPPLEPEPPSEAQLQEEKEYCFKHVLSNKELQEVRNLLSSGNMDESGRYLASILHLQDYNIIAHNAFALDYCIGILIFAQEAGIGEQQTLKFYSLGLEILDIVRRNGEFEEAENLFKQRIMSLGFEDVNPQCTPIDIQKATNYFTETIFQHYNLYKYCFTKEHCCVKTTAKVYIETPLVLPTSEALIAAEYEAQRERQAAAIVAMAAEEQAKKDAEEKAEADALAQAEALRLEEERRHKPSTLEEAIEFVVREKMEDARMVMAQEHTNMLERFKQIQQQGADVALAHPVDRKASVDKKASPTANVDKKTGKPSKK